MNLKKMLIALPLILGLALISYPQKSQAGETIWAVVSIDSIYYHKDGWCTARLSEVDGLFREKLFRATTDNSKAILAVILTAQSLNKNIRVAFKDASPAAEIILAGMVN